MRFDPVSRSLYLVDGSRIRRVNVATRQVITISGGDRIGIPAEKDGFGDAIIKSPRTGTGALDVVARKLYFPGEGTLREFDLVTNEVKTIAGRAGANAYVDGPHATARLEYPNSVALDPAAGVAYVAEAQRLRSVSLATGAVGTYSGQRFDVVIHHDASNTLYGVAGTGQIHKIPLGGGAPTTLQYGGGDDLAIDAAGVKLYQGWTRFIQVQDLAAVTKTTLATTDVVGVALDEAQGKVYARALGIIRQVDIATGAVTDFVGRPDPTGAVEGAATDVVLRAPYGVTVDGAGRAFVAGNNTIRTVTLATGDTKLLAGYPGVESVDDGPRGAGGFSDLKGLAYAPTTKTLYAADSTMLRAVDTTTGAVTTVAGSWTGAGKVDGPKVASRLKAPTALAFADDGQLYFTDGEWLRKLDPTSTVVSTVTSTSPAPKGLGGLAISKKRNKIFVSAPSDCVVRSIDRTSFVVSTIGGVVDECAFTDGSAASARFVTPTTLALDDAQDLLYVADRWGIRVLDLNTGNTSTLFGGVNRVGVRLGPLSTASVAHTLSDGMFIPFALVGPGDLILGSESALLRARK